MFRTLKISIAAFVVLAVPTVAAAASKVTLAPTVAPPTEWLKVTASGFTVGRLIDVYFDTTNQCLLIAASGGGGTCRFKIPDTAQPGSHWITVVDRNAGTGVQAKFLVRTDWAHPRGQTTQHDGFNRYENTISTKNAGLLKPVWSKPSLQIVGTPVVAGGIVYTGALDGKLYAFNADTGATIRGFPKVVGDQVYYSSPVVSGGNVYVAGLVNGDTTKLAAFNATTGATTKGFPKTLGGFTVAAPLVVSGKLYTGASDGRIYGFNATTGAKLTHYPISVAGAPVLMDSPAAYGNLIYVGGEDGKLYAFDRTTGASVFTATTTGKFGFSPPAISGNALYFGTPEEKKVHRADPRTGADTWPANYSLGGSYYGSPSIANGNVYVNDTTGTTTAIDTGSGTMTWSRKLGRPTYSGAVTVANGVVYTSDADHLHALDASTGKLLGSFGSGFTSGQSVAVVNGTVYAGFSSGGLVAYRPVGVAAASARIAARPEISSLRPDLSLKLQ